MRVAIRWDERWAEYLTGDPLVVNLPAGRLMVLWTTADELERASRQLP